MAFKLNHLHFKSPDPRRTAQWYVDYLGAKIISESEGQSGPSYRLDLHGITASITTINPEHSTERQFHGLEHIAIDSSSYEADVAKLKGDGAKVMEERNPAGGRRVCFFQGPEGVQVELLEAA